MVSVLKRKAYSIPLSPADVLDVKFAIRSNAIESFSLNYRTKISGNFFEVYRVDTAHGFLHAQRYWITPEPIPIPSLGKDLNELFNFYLDLVRKDFLRFKKHYLTRMRLR